MTNTTPERRPMSDDEYLSLLDYALDMLTEMEQQIDACCETMRERAKGVS